MTDDAAQTPIASPDDSSLTADVGPLASPLKRIGARFIDSFAVYLVFGFAINSAFGIGPDGDNDVVSVYAATALVVGVGFLWDPLLTKLFGGTPMKLALGMRVVADTGAPVEWSHVLKRWGIVALWLVVPWLNVVVPLVLVVVSFAFLFTKPMRTAVWDQFGGTLVVDAGSLSRTPR